MCLLLSHNKLQLCWFNLSVYVAVTKCLLPDIRIRLFLGALSKLRKAIIAS